MALRSFLWTLFAVAAQAQVPPVIQLSVYGPQTVTAGRSLIFGIVGKVLSGDDQQTEVSLSGAPPNAKIDFVTQTRFCCGTKLYRATGTNTIRITTALDTPPGTYPVSVTYSAPGAQQSVLYNLHVLPPPGPVPTSYFAFPPDLPLPAEALWSANMLTYGLKHCNKANLGLWEGSVWYYDGIRVYYQIQEATQNASWTTCADLVKGLYRSYVIDNSGSIPGWRVFAQGLALDYLRTGEKDSQTAIKLLLDHSPYAFPDGDPAYRISFESSREMAYALEAHLALERILNTPRRQDFNDTLEMVFGHFDQWFVSRTASYLQPFMVALSAEALIEYYETTPDPRVLPLLKMAADELWAQKWDTASQSFLYTEPPDPSHPAVDLNLLIAPLYGWVFQHTGEAIYRERGDKIFTAGVAGAWLDGGKQFSQNYRWSNRYLEWRQAPRASDARWRRR
jgi:hypothetical protein